MKRRHFLRVTGIALFGLSHPKLWAQLPQSLQRTPSDQEGPYYPVGGRDDIDHDLLHVAGKHGRASGTRLTLQGRVVNTQEQPVAGCIVEIWQTDPQGRYLHPNDPSAGERDPNFQYFGRATSDVTGQYRFQTLLPGSYRPRPRHIHFKVWNDEKLLLTSQIYPRLPGEPFFSGIRSQLQLFLEQVDKDNFYGYFEIVL